MKGLAISKANLKFLRGAPNLCTPLLNRESPATLPLVSSRLEKSFSILSPFNITLFTSSPKLLTASRYAALQRSVDPAATVSSSSSTTAKLLLARTLSSTSQVSDEIGGLDAVMIDVGSLCTDAERFLPLSNRCMLAGSLVRPTSSMIP